MFLLSLLLFSFKQLNIISRHLERFSSWNIPGWDSGVAERERQRRKHSDETKSAKAVQGNGAINSFLLFSVHILGISFHHSINRLSAGIRVYLFQHWRSIEAVLRTFGHKNIQRQWNAGVITVGLSDSWCFANGKRCWLYTDNDDLEIYVG